MCIGSLCVLYVRRWAQGELGADAGPPVSMQNRPVRRRYCEATYAQPKEDRAVPARGDYGGESGFIRGAGGRFPTVSVRLASPCDLFLFNLVHLSRYIL